MAQKMLPFNITLLQLTDEMVQGITPVTTLDIFNNNTKNFDENGLFSTEIFGKVGTKDRMRRFSYIQLATPILHPIIYRTITQLKAYYEDIFKGVQYATFDPVSKEMIRCAPTEGETGFNFMLRHLDQMKFTHNTSDRRDLKIELLDKFRKKGLTDRIIIIPAGYRDFIVDKEGKPTEDEINGLYRKFLSKNNLLSKSAIHANLGDLDSIVYSLQDTFNELYAYIKEMLDGKNKLILGKWASRRIYNSTRNVASAPILTVEDLDDADSVKMDQTQVGLYQYIKGTLPITIHLLRSKFLDESIQMNGNAFLINPKGLHNEAIVLDGLEYARWSTDDGLEKVVTSFLEEESRNLPVIIGGFYLRLIARKGINGKQIMILKDISELNTDFFTPQDVHPMTYGEMYRLAIGDDYKDHPAMFTRYPVTGVGSIYPSNTYLRSTYNADTVYELSTDGSTLQKYTEFPRLNEKYYDTLSTSPIHMARLDLDFDGDVVSWTAMFSEQSKNEIKKLLNSTKFYTDLNGNLIFGANYATVEYVINNMTAEPEN